MEHRLGRSKVGNDGRNDGVDILAGSSNYEDGLKAGPSVRQFGAAGEPLRDAFPGAISSTSPLALADLTGGGRMALFVGGRVVPGRYPEPAKSSLYRQNQGAWQLEVENTQVLETAGMVSGAVWSDLDGDGYPELVLACDWGPIRVFKNSSGRLRDATMDYGLSGYTGWWTGVSTGDVDGDGRLDIVASNWGLNSPYHANPQHPLRMYLGDFMQRGTVDLLETEYHPNRGVVVPFHRLDFIAAGLPMIREHYPTFKAFSETTIDQVLATFPTRAQFVEVTTFASMVFLNRGDHFEAVELPREAQFAPATGVNIADFDGDGREDVFLSQNVLDTRWEVPRQDAGRGLLLLGQGNGRFRPVPALESGISIVGEQRGSAMADFNEDGRVDLAVTQNGAATRLFVNQGARPGLRVRLQGLKNNPVGIGAVLRVGFGDSWGPAREVHAGSGYGSQDSPVQVMAIPRPPFNVQVRWPGGRTTLYPVPPSARELTVRQPEG